MTHTHRKVKGVLKNAKNLSYILHDRTFVAPPPPKNDKQFLIEKGKLVIGLTFK